MKRHEHSGGGINHFDNPSEITSKMGIEKGDILLDVGCGRGVFSAAASELVGSTGKIYALDIYEDSIIELQKTIKKMGLNNIETIIADAVKTIPLPDNSVDICLMSNVLHGFMANNEFPGLMVNIERVIKKEGRLAIIEFKKSPSPFGPPIDIRLSTDEVNNMFKLYGYAIINEFEAGLYHYGIILRK